MPGTIPHEDCVNSGDTAWLLTSSAFVLSMIFGLSFFESGMLPRKMALNIIVQITVGMMVVLLLFQLFEFSLIFGEDHGGVIGDFSYVLFIGLQNVCLRDHAPHIPALSFASFQYMFASIAPLLITGTVAGRMRLSRVLLFVAFWSLFVYTPVAHWIWGNGWLEQNGVLDFAGGLVLHATAGTSSLVIAWAIGKRHDWDVHKGEAEPHNIVLASIGCAFLFFGWYGFNAGSALAANTVASSAAINTTNGALVSALVWVIIGVVRSSLSDKHIRATVLVPDILNGFLAGLAGITPASGYVAVYYSLPIGVLLGLASYAGVHIVAHFEIDDALDVSSIHGLTGVLGSFCIGIFADTSINPNGGDGLITGKGHLFAWQCIAIVVTIAWSALMTSVFCFVLPRLFFWDWRMGHEPHRRFLRSRIEHEKAGLDKIYGHGSAYNHQKTTQEHEPAHKYPFNDYSAHSRYDQMTSSSEDEVITNEYLSINVAPPNEQTPIVQSKVEKSNQ
mmetsp:Transcript_2061/g.2928  ORF Transcript_2061/g.2928 Transcript_2061/m.2928 type:complete len:503 (+) Transcript_2061:103-1611(+)|eukprot:CAMPEP_0201555202 /NCGR_PEP_ID=MMETSP0173_2-20130828/47324_1 /ASSEMBLY_ACC=CAM_ASM_000268 /TAXON_ID=218659 /ORGANISM="Vexillifera sp., Strain DIVA3 564/2" /LENGTH=502 /DNA_ID=CAMNT_0047966869 /DNA_START=32 /DNA_END=1540 /DNA_ORIENTATION=-